jgi:4-hydroxy-tetrahydrodipicolinate reductase
MKIALLGASGRVGKCLTKHILTSSDNTLVGAYVSAESESLGKQVDDTELKFLTIESSLDQPVDLIIDFSTPAATMAILDKLSQRTRAIVIGTTGFTPDEEQNIEDASLHSPIMIGANFAKSFEVFVAVCKQLAATYPQHVPQLEETYHERKKAVPSGTSLRLARELAEARKLAGCTVMEEIPIKVNRVGDATGTHVCSVNQGQYEISISFTVEGLGSYAEGALAAGHWLEGRPNGLYVPADMLEKKFEDERLVLPDFE